MASAIKRGHKKSASGERLCARACGMSDPATDFAVTPKTLAGFSALVNSLRTCGSAHTQTRNPDAVRNHLNFCMAATTITWIYAEHSKQAPIRRYASQDSSEYAFADVRRSLAKHLARESLGIGCQDPDKAHQEPLISAVMRLVA